MNIDLSQLLKDNLTSHKTHRMQDVYVVYVSRLVPDPDAVPFTDAPRQKHYCEALHVASDEFSAKGFRDGFNKGAPVASARILVLKGRDLR